MLPVLTPSEMAAVDAAAREPVEVLIERAGAAVAHAALEMVGGGYGRHVVVLAGPGNNGADGRAAARRLRRRGARVDVVDIAAAPARLAPCDLVVDAAFGTGFRGRHTAPDPGATPVLAVDIPSGVSGLTGSTSGQVLSAQRTVTFAALKPGLLFQPGRDLAGAVSVADIGLDVGTSAAVLVEEADVAGWVPARRSEGHKWQSALLVIAGSPRMSGAAHLVAAAAQRAGAGMVRVGTPGVADDPGRPVEAVGVELEHDGWGAAAERCQAMVIGPGLGRAAATVAEVRRTLASVPLPAVVDADGLVALGTDAADVLKHRGADTVLTPHDGEFEHLMGERPGPDRIAAARSLAQRSGAVTLLKGSTTVVAHPDGRVRVTTTGDGRLATAGTGDVLSGVIGAMLARGATAFDAAAASAWLHGSAGRLGPVEGFIARDLIHHLPTVLDAARAAGGGER